MYIVTVLVNVTTQMLLKPGNPVVNIYDNINISLRTHI